MPGNWRGPRPGRVTRITVRGGVMLAVSAIAFAMAYILGWDELLVVGCFAGMPPFLAFLFIRGVRPRLSATRAVLPLTISLGNSGLIRFTVANESGWRMPSARWHDALPWEPGKTPSAFLGSLTTRERGNGIAVLRYQLSPPRRGLFEIGPLMVTFTDPFGLVRGDFSVAGHQRLVVTPEIVALPPEAVQIATDDGSARRFQQHAFAGDDDLMTRNYRPGDALRRIHWRTSARQGELMVRENEQPRRAEVVLVLETRGTAYPDVLRGHHPDLSESAAFEWALRMTGSLSAHLGLAGIPIRVVETAPAQLPAQGYGDEFRHGLASIRLSYSGDGWFGLMPSGSRSPSRAASAIAILADPDEGTVRKLVELRDSCDVAVAFVIAPRSSSGVGALRRAGWMCVPVTPDEPVAEVWRSLSTEERDAAR